MDGSRRGSGTVPSLPPPSPNSPPDYPDLYGKRRELAMLQMLDRQIGFLQEELKSVERIQTASHSCKEVADFVMTNSDPLITISCKIRRSRRVWRWLWNYFLPTGFLHLGSVIPGLSLVTYDLSCQDWTFVESLLRGCIGKSCFNLSWICCCCGCCPHYGQSDCSEPKCPSCSSSCWRCSCLQGSCSNCCNCDCSLCPDCSWSSTCSCSKCTCCWRPRCQKV